MEITSANFCSGCLNLPHLRATLPAVPEGCGRGRSGGALALLRVG